MNQAVQQKKVASIVSQLQTGTNTTGSSPTGTLRKQESLEKAKNIQNSTELVTFDDVSIWWHFCIPFHFLVLSNETFVFKFRAGYIRKCLEVERLQVMVSLKDKRIKELESYVELLGSANTQWNET